MKVKWKSVIKAAAAIAAALIILDLFCAWYYNPTDYLHDEFRATDNIRVPGVFTSRAKEGIAWSVIDENGYNNPYMPGEDGISVLMMGSSHTEALNVMPDESASWLLNEKMTEDGAKGCVYNIGISSHNLARNSHNLRRALERFQPHDYVVIETMELEFNQAYIDQGMEKKEGRLAATDFAIPKWLSDRPLLRTLYRQWTSFAGKGGENDEAGSEGASTGNRKMSASAQEKYTRALTEWFSYMAEIADEYGVELIIYYHPHLMLQADGTAAPMTNGQCLDAFVQAAEAADIIFLDMTGPFMEAYESRHILPHGFINTAMGTGHLNADGHAMIADALYEIISEREEAKS